MLADDLLKVPPTAASDLPIGEHFTRSRSAHTSKRTCRKPRRASTGVKYGETSSLEDVPIPVIPKPKPPAAKPNRSGPTANRINSRNKSSVAPTVRLPPIKTEHIEVPDKDETAIAENTVDPNNSPEDNIPLAEIARKLRGTFKTTQHVLKKS